VEVERARTRNALGIYWLQVLENGVRIKPPHRPGFFFLKEAAMRGLALGLILAAAAPAAANELRIILTIDQNLRFTDAKCNPLKVEPGGYVVTYDKAQRADKLTTWDGVDAWVKGTAGVLAKDAIADLTGQIRAVPVDGRPAESLASLYKYRGIAWSLANEYDIAIADFTESLRLDPKQADVYMHRGHAWYWKDLARIKPAFVAADTFRVFLGISFHPNVPKTAYDHAIDDYDRALRLDPESAQVYSLRADARREKWQTPWYSLIETLADTDQKWKNAKAAAKEPKALVADWHTDVERRKKSLLQANARFTQAEKDMATAKDELATAREFSVKSAKEYAALAEANFKKRDNEFDVARSKWREARDVATRLTQQLDTANEVLVNLTKALDKANKETSAVDDKRAEARNQFDVAKTDLKDAIADYDEVRRLRPNAITAIQQRTLAVALLAEARLLLQQYKRNEN
jgi:hypothetical protein